MFLSISGCAGVQTTYDQPVVSLTSFRFLPGDSIVPKFEIGLQIINPNRDELKLDGIFYTVTIEDHRILSGVASELPIVAGYGEEDILLVASVDVISGARLIQTLLTKPTDSFHYGFHAKLDLGSFRLPLKISEEGQFTPGPQ